MFYVCIPIALVLAAVSPSQAQDAPLPKPETQDPAESPRPRAESSPPPPQLIPPDVLPLPQVLPSEIAPNIPGIEQLDESLKQPPLSPAAENQRRQIEWRRLRNRVRNDNELKAAVARAEAAGTDLERRQLLRRYYQLLYGKLAAIAPADMKSYLEDRKNEALNGLSQPRVRPEKVATAAARVSPTPQQR